MYDIELVREILHQIRWSAQTIAKRFASIASPDDFVTSEEGLEKLDAICMQLITIGENVKNLDKVTVGGLLLRYPQIEWKRGHGEAGDYPVDWGAVGTLTFSQHIGQE